MAAKWPEKAIILPRSHSDGCTSEIGYPKCTHLICPLSEVHPASDTPLSEVHPSDVPLSKVHPSDLPLI